MDIRSLIVARFAVQPAGILWKISPVALPTLQRWDIAITPEGMFAPPDEWITARNLTNYIRLISENEGIFSDSLRQLMQLNSNTLERCTQFITREEYSIILSFAGRDLYDFFVFDHRFGPPPRGKKYRSNIRGEWVIKVGDRKINRPDNAVLALKRKIERYRSMGASTVELEAELIRREKRLSVLKYEEIQSYQDGSRLRLVHDRESSK